VKGYIPANRNSIVLIISGNNSHDLLARAGKEELAVEIVREAVRSMGIDIPAPQPINRARDASDAAVEPEVNSTRRH